MEPAAYNYREAADIADGSCLYQGCLNSLAFNYDSSATLPGRCISVLVGCMDPVAHNYYLQANTAGACRYSGCTDSARPNYDPIATVDDGFCEEWFRGCTNSRAGNYHAWFDQDDGSCSIAGCQATDAAATFNVPCLCTGDCGAGRRRKLEDAADCWDPVALNYNASSASGVGCVYAVAGCTDSAATNYRRIANVDDGGCNIPSHGCSIAESSASMLKCPPHSLRLSRLGPCASWLLRIWLGRIWLLWAS